MTCSAHLNTLSDLPPVAVKIILWVFFFFFFYDMFVFWDSCIRWRCFHSTRKMKLKTFSSMISSREKCQAFFLAAEVSKTWANKIKTTLSARLLKYEFPNFCFFFFSRAVTAQVALWWFAQRRRIMWKNKEWYLQFSCINWSFSFQSVHQESVLQENKAKLVESALKLKVHCVRASHLSNTYSEQKWVTYRC